MHSVWGSASVNGTRLHYELAGEGEPLVLIHGNTLDLRMWEDQMPAFAERYRVLRYDMRGFGESDVPGADSYSPTDDLQALLSKLGIAHAHILGLSLGGAIAVEFALAHPHMTDSLIAVDAGLRAFSWVVYGDFSAWVRTAAVSEGIDVARQRWLAGALFAPAMEHPQLAARLQHMVTEYSGWHWLNRDPVCPLEPPPAEQLDCINVPTLVVVGERDIPDFHAVADLLQERIPNASKIVMPGVGHMSNMEDPARFNTLVLEFLAGLN